MQGFRRCRAAHDFFAIIVVIAVNGKTPLHPPILTRPVDVQIADLSASSTITNNTTNIEARRSVVSNAMVKRAILNIVIADPMREAEHTTVVS